MRQHERRYEMRQHENMDQVTIASENIYIKI